MFVFEWFTAINCAILLSQMKFYCDVSADK